MFLSLSIEGEGAEDLSFVVQKHPAKVYERGSIKVFFPKYGIRQASVVAAVEFPEYKLWNQDTPMADAYVSSREYAAGSLFCRELKQAFNTAISGNYKDASDKEKAERQYDITVDALPFATTLTDEQMRGLFNPLRYAGFSPSYTVDHSYGHPWMPGKHRVLELAMRGRKTVREVLRHLLVLMPVIDNYTHYEDYDVLVAELKKHGEGWLDEHPMKDFIASRFLRHSRKLIKEFDGAEERTEGEAALEKRILLGDLRTKWFVDTVKSLGARSVVDAGCGSGRLAESLNNAGVLEVGAFDCHTKAVFAAKRRLENKANVFFSSLIYRDSRLEGKDAILLQEVVEHLSPFQLQRAMDLIFKVYRPKAVLMSTPNRSYNKFFGMAEGTFRHRDHKFEFDEAEAALFAASMEPNGYSCYVAPIGQDYTPPTPKESMEIEARKHSSDSSAPQTAVMERPPVVAGEFPTFGLVFKRND